MTQILTPDNKNEVQTWKYEARGSILCAIAAASCLEQAETQKTLQQQDMHCNPLPFSYCIFFSIALSKFPIILGINPFLKSTHFTYQLFSPEKINNPLKTYKEEKSNNTIASPFLCFSSTLTSFDTHLK